MGWQTTTVRNGGPYAIDGVVDGEEGRLLVAVEAAAVAVQDVDAALLGRLADAHVHAVVGPVVEVARVHVEPLRMEVEDDVDDVLVAPRDLGLVLLVDRDDVLLPAKVPHPRQVHQHHAGIDACRMYRVFISLYTELQRCNVWMLSES